MPEQTAHWRELLPLLVFMIVMFILFYTIVVAPVKKRQKSHLELIASLREGDEIVTAGGIYGKIVKVREETVDVEVAPNVRLKFDRRAIRRKVGERN